MDLEIVAKWLIFMVQLGGLEPPTSCSTDRRSNQLSYNCIVCRPKNGRRTRRKLGATPAFGKAGDNTIGAIRAYKKVPQKQKARALRPGFSDAKTLLDQAAGLNSFEALALIGSTGSVAAFLPNSAGFLAWAVKASYCFRAFGGHRSTASEGELAPTSSCPK